MTDIKGELQIKDLLLKLHVLTYGIIEERKKSQTYLVRIKELQDSLQKKEMEVVELTKSKFDLQSKLSLELSKKTQTKKSDWNFSSIMNKIREKPGDSAYINELEGKINQLNFEIKDLSQRLMESNENFDQQKMQFQTMITLQKQEMAKVQKELEEEKKKVKIVEKVEVKSIEDNESKNKLKALQDEFRFKKGEYESKIENLNNELEKEKKNKDEITKLNKQLQDTKNECEMKKLENSSMKTQITKLDKDLKKAKLEAKDVKLGERFFQVDRVKDNLLKSKATKPMTLLFRFVHGENRGKGRCEVVIKREKHGGVIKEEIVNVLDFKTFKINDKKKDVFDLDYTVSKYIYNNNFLLLQADGEQVKYSIIANELIQDYLHKTYREFHDKAKEISM